MKAHSRVNVGGRQLSFRPIQPADDEVLFQVYASSRETELAPVPWTSEQKESFLRMQFAAQHQHYQTHFADADFLLILGNDVPIGRLYIARWDREIRLIDIALLPEFRGQGIGSTLLKALQQEAEQTARSLTTHVEQFNPALRLYLRLGFRKVNVVGVYFLMNWQPEVPSV